MILAVDVQYHNESGFAAGLIFNSSNATSPDEIFYAKTTPVEEYIPGEFYKRELPCIMRLLRENSVHPDRIIIDGYVYLDGVSLPGLGYFLFNELNQKIPVIGVAKTSFGNISENFSILRGKSKKPLYITSIGIGLQESKDIIKSMHGNDRIPTLLKSVDRFCRESVKAYKY